MKASEVIREARNVLFERGWYQGDFVGPDGSVCAYGALVVAEGMEVRKSNADAGTCETDAADYFERAIPVLSMFDWNDKPGRTLNEVMEALDKAEKLALIAEEA